MIIIRIIGLFQLKCCGMVGFEDWENSEWRREKSISYINLVPPSCCKTWTALCGRWDIPNNIHYDVRMLFTYLCCSNSLLDGLNCN